MSHTVKIKTQFKSWEAVKKAFEQFGWTIKENTKIRTYYSDPQKDKIYQYVAFNPKQGYDLGLAIKQDGEIEVYGDFFDGSIQKSLGSDLCELKKKYSTQVIEDEFLCKGYSVNYETLANGTVEVVVEQ